MVFDKIYLKEVHRVDAPGDIEALLPWHAVGKLTAQDRRRVMRVLAMDPVLAETYATICEERAAIAHAPDDLEAFSERARDKLFAAIDVEPPRGVAGGRRLIIRLSAVSCTDRALKHLADIA